MKIIDFYVIVIIPVYDCEKVIVCIHKNTIRGPGRAAPGDKAPRSYSPGAAAGRTRTTAGTRTRTSAKTRNITINKTRT